MVVSWILHWFPCILWCQESSLYLIFCKNDTMNFKPSGTHRLNFHLPPWLIPTVPSPWVPDSAIWVGWFALPGIRALTLGVLFLYDDASTDDDAVETRSFLRKLGRQVASLGYGMGSCGLLCPCWSFCFVLVGRPLGCKEFTGGIQLAVFGHLFPWHLGLICVSSDSADCRAHQKRIIVRLHLHKTCSPLRCPSRSS